VLGKKMIFYCKKSILKKGIVKQKRNMSAEGDLAKINQVIGQGYIS